MFLPVTCHRAGDKFYPSLSEQGILALSSMSDGPWSHFVHAGVTLVAYAMDFTFIELLEKDRKWYWDTLRSSLVKGPAMFLNSDADPLVDTTRVKELAGSLRLKGREVWERRWKDSTHLAHYRYCSQCAAQFMQHTCSGILLLGCQFSAG